MSYYHFIRVACCITLSINIVISSPHSAFLAENSQRSSSRSHQNLSSVRRSARLQEQEKVLVPPDYKYKAFGKVNITVIDSGGLPWYCYTGNHVRCVPLFRLPGKWRTTRFPHIYTPTTPPNPNKARSTITTTTTTFSTTIMVPEEDTTPMTTAARFSSTTNQFATRIPRLNRELNYSRPVYQEEIVESKLQKETSLPSSIPVPEGLTFSRLINVSPKKKTSERNKGRAGWKNTQQNRRNLPRRTQNNRPSSVIKFRKTINVVDKGGQHLNFTTQKINEDRSQTWNAENGNSYTKVNINHDGWIPINVDSNRFQSRLDSDVQNNHFNGLNDVREANNDEINQWTSSFSMEDSSNGELSNGRREGFVAQNINQFIYTKFVRPNQVYIF